MPDKMTGSEVGTTMEFKRVAHVRPQLTMNGGCLVCGRTVDVVVLPTSVAGFGQPCICARCVRLAGKTIDLGSIAVQKARIAELKDQLADARSTITDQSVVIASYESLHQAKKRIDPALPDDVPLPGLT